MSSLLQIPTNQPAPKSFGAASNPPNTIVEARQTAIRAIQSIEGLALQHGLLPVTLVRESCSPDAERLIRKLGRVPYVADPWLPVSTIGPLLVMAHHNPRAGDLWGVPHFLTIRVLITQEQYQNTRKDLVQRQPLLRLLDAVAYVRFASVYRDFREARDFNALIDELESGVDPDLDGDADI